MFEVTQDILEHSWKQLNYRLHLCISAYGAHVEIVNRK